MYLITFHSQFDSNIFKREMSGYGDVVQKPVPRKLSSSCGTCCTVDPLDPEECLKAISALEYEKIYSVLEGDDYELISSKD